MGEGQEGSAPVAVAALEKDWTLSASLPTVRFALCSLIVVIYNFTVELAVEGRASLYFTSSPNTVSHLSRFSDLDESESPSEHSVYTLVSS